ncbi:MAG: CcdB family protein [Geminicoccaceae bacterium]
MTQFDVYRNPANGTDDGFPYMLDIQCDLLDHLSLRVVVPLVRADVVDPPLPRLNPRFFVEESAVVMATTLIGGLPVRSLRDLITNLGHHRREIIDAIDMLITGV